MKSLLDKQRDTSGVIDVGMMDKMDLDEDTPIESRMLTRAIENAQTTVESRNFQSRKSVLEYDDVMLRKTTGLPVVSTVHSDYKLDYLGRPFSRLTFGCINARALRKLDYRIGVSDAMFNDQPVQHRQQSRHSTG